MIHYVVGDLFHSPAKVLVNTVNTKGVMGKGLAKDFKAIYPEMFKAYQELCDTKKLDIGRLHLFRTPHKWVLNFPTKRDWRYPSKTEYIEAGLKAFVAGYARADITSVAFPQLGCGHGDLDWADQVQPIMEQYLAKLPISIFIHLYRKDVFPKEHASIAETRRWLHGEPESLGFQEVWEDILDLFKAGEGWVTLSSRPLIQVSRLERVFDDGEGLRFRNGAHDGLEISKDVLLDVWQHFRASGVLMPGTLPHGLEKHATALFALFSQLPYVRKVEVAQGRAPASENFVAALQLTPRTAEETLEILALTPATTVHA
jgi:O-acetyl-ADP-ribose deacetylase (regulator of RNase III)